VTGNFSKGIKGMKIGSIVIRCYEFDKMLAFWQEALGYAPREPAKSGWVVLRDPQGRGPNLSLQQVPEKRSGRRSRLHLDLYTDNKEVEVDRLVTIGATRYPWRYRPGQRLYRPGRSRQQSFLRGPTSQGLKHGAGIHSCRKGFALPVTCGLWPRLF